MQQPVPTVIGSAGLTGRPSVRPFELPDPEQEPVDGGRVGQAMPSPCLRVLSVPHAVCSGDCQGLQDDGGCLADLIRECRAAGFEPEFTVTADGYWRPAS